jgi:hypothetical protein
VLNGGLLQRRIAGVERASPEQDPRPVVEVQLGQRGGFHADAAQAALVQAGGSEEGGVLTLGGVVLGARGQEEEGPHGANPRQPGAVDAAVSLGTTPPQD